MIKVFGCDVDGTLTDASVYLSANGEEMLKFNRRDGHGFFLLREQGVKTLVISGEDHPIICNRCKKMKADHFFLGIQDKFPLLDKFLLDNDYTWDEFAYIGDDLNDSEVIQSAGISATPGNGVLENQQQAHYICMKNGGDGCVREFIDLILDGRIKKTGKIWTIEMAKRS